VPAFRDEFVLPKSSAFKRIARYFSDRLLGLKLQSGKKAQVEVLVIDQVERPDAN
jgi:hypothetical protein